MSEDNADVSPAFPAPSRKWFKDDVLIYSVDKIGSEPFGGLNNDFYTQGSNALLITGVLLPMPCILHNDGSIEITFANLMIAFPDALPEGITESNVKTTLFDTLLGSWKCEVGNLLGTESAVTVISECN